MQNLSHDELIQWIVTNNKDVKAGADFFDTPPSYLISRTPIKKLNLPDGWKYNRKRGTISNQKHFFSKNYVEVKIVKVDYIDIE